MREELVTNGLCSDNEDDIIYVINIMYIISIDQIVYSPKKNIMPILRRGVN